MITRIEATRYRCFDKLDVELGEFRVLVGANGSGKTTLLDVPVLLGDLLRERTISAAFTALRHSGPLLRLLLAQNGRWPHDAAKPLAPKENILALIRANRAGPPMVVYSQIARAVSTAGCVNPAFRHVRDALRAWFPAEDA